MNKEKILIFRNVLYLAWMDTKIRYRSSVLGPFWPVLVNIISVLGLSLVWATLMQQNMKTFVPQLSIGLIVWQLISGVISDGPGVFVRQALMMKNINQPCWFFTVRQISRQIINFLHNIIIIIGVMLYFQTEISAKTLFVIPGLVLVILNLYWVMHMLGLIGARFRDIEPLIQSLIPLLFFMSPVLYKADRIPAGLNIVWLNPLSYMIEAVRSPLLGLDPNLTTYLVLTLLCVIGLIFTWWFQVSKGKNIIYWI